MLSKSLSLAKALLVLSIGIALTSFYFNQSWSSQITSLSGSVQQQDRKLREAEVARAELKESLNPDATPITLDVALSEAMLRVFNSRVANDITISYVTPGRLGGGSALTRITDLAEDVPGTKIKSVRINVNGTYATYDGLMGFLKSIQQGPVAIVRLKVQDQTFEASLRVYGNE